MWAHTPPAPSYPVIVTKSTMVVKFTSDNGSQRYLRHAMPAGFIARAVSTTTPPATCPGDKYGGDCTVTYCMGTTHHTGDGVVTAAYRNNAVCAWAITTTTPSKVVEITWDTFDTEVGFDFVTFYDGADDKQEVIGRFSGQLTPPTIRSSTGEIFVTFTSDNIIHAGRGFQFQYNEVSNFVTTLCEPGTFGKMCDTQVCFGVTDVELDSTNTIPYTQRITSGVNPLGGVGCTFKVLAESAADTAVITFEKLHLEPESGDVVRVYVGGDDADNAEHTRIVGVDRACTKGSDCNKYADQVTGTCVFADAADVYGVCVCAEGYFNGDCSTSVVVVDLAGANSEVAVRIVYETDVNDIRTEETVEWELSVRACGGSLPTCPMDVLMGGGGGGGISVAVIGAVVGGSILAILAVASYFRWAISVEKVKVKNQEAKLGMNERVMQSLRDELKILQQYNEDEKAMIEEQIMTFRKEHHESKKAMDPLKDLDASQVDLQKLLLKASEIESLEVIGKGR